MRLRYDIVDVFTDRPFAGNQLAVVHGADDLSTEQCLALAREFNFSETTFPAPGRRTARVRHPDLHARARRSRSPATRRSGTAWVLRSRGLLGPATRSPRSAAPAGSGCASTATGSSCPATPRDLVGPVADELVAALVADLGLSLTDLAGPVVRRRLRAELRARPGRRRTRWPGRRSSTRPLSEYVDPPIETPGPVRGDQPVRRRRATRPRSTCTPGCSCPGCRSRRTRRPARPRPGSGIALVASGLLPEGGRYDITQGVEMGRPSPLHGRVEAADGAATAVPRRRRGPARGDRARSPSRRSAEPSGRRLHAAGAGSAAAAPRVRRRRSAAASARWASSESDPGCSTSSPVGTSRVHAAGPGPAVGGGGQVRRGSAGPDTSARGDAAPTLVVGAYADALATQVSEPAAVLLAAHRDLDPGAVARCRGAAARCRPRRPERTGVDLDPDVPRRVRLDVRTRRQPETPVFFASSATSASVTPLVLRSGSGRGAGRLRRVGHGVERARLMARCAPSC